MEEGWQGEFMSTLDGALQRGTSQVVMLFTMKNCPWCEQMLSVVEDAVQGRATDEPAVPPRGADLLQAPLRVFVLDSDDFPSVAAQFGAKVFPSTVVWGHPGTTPVMAHGYLSEENFAEMVQVAVLGRSAAVTGTFEDRNTSPQSLAQVSEEKKGKGPLSMFAKFLQALNPASAAKKASSYELGVGAAAVKEGWEKDFMGNLNEALEDGTSQVAIIFSMHGCPWCDKMVDVAEETVKSRAQVASTGEDDMLSGPLRVFVLNAEDFPAAARQFGVQAFPTIIAFGSPGDRPILAQGFLEADDFGEMLKMAVEGPPEDEEEADEEQSEQS